MVFRNQLGKQMIKISSFIIVVLKNYQQNIMTIKVKHQHYVKKTTSIKKFGSIYTLIIQQLAKLFILLIFANFDLLQ